MTLGLDVRSCKLICEDGVEMKHSSILVKSGNLEDGLLVAAMLNIDPSRVTLFVPCATLVLGQDAGMFVSL